MSWDDQTTDMAHCHWCSWDLYKGDAVNGMHRECEIKAARRGALVNRIRPQLVALGLKPDYQNLLTDVCLRIEKAMDKEQTS